MPPRVATNSQRLVDFLFKFVRIRETFYKTYATTRSIGPRSTKLESFRSRRIAMLLHTPPKKPAGTASVSRANMRHLTKSRASMLHVLPRPIFWHAPQFYDVTKPGLARLSRFDPFILTRIWTTCQKRKKKEEKALTMVDFDQKVKIFKTDLSHSVFRVHFNFGIRFFIWNLEIAQTSDFQKVDLCINLDRKSEISRTCLALFFT